MPDPNDRPRVLHVITRMNIGGPARHVLALMPGLREHGFETLVAFGTPEPDEGELRPGPRRTLGPDRDAPAADRPGCRPTCDHRAHPVGRPLPARRRAHAHGEGRGARPERRAQGQGPRGRPHVPRARARGLLRLAGEFGIRDRRAAAGASHRCVDRRVRIHPRRPARARDRHARAMDGRAPRPGSRARCSSSR